MDELFAIARDAAIAWTGIQYERKLDPRDYVDFWLGMYLIKEHGDYAAYNRVANFDGDTDLLQDVIARQVTEYEQIMNL